jgi:hypothetical protein
MMRLKKVISRNERNWILFYKSLFGTGSTGLSGSFFCPLSGRERTNPNRLRQIGIYSTIVELRLVKYLYQFQKPQFVISFPLKADCIFSVSSENRKLTKENPENPV